MRLASAMVFLAILTPPAISSPATAPQGGAYTVYGSGAMSCGKWTSVRKGSDWYTEGQWVLGYVTAHERTSSVKMTSTDSDGIAGWIDTYCAANSLDTLARAANALVLELGWKR